MNYTTIRGFNYQPSYGSSGLELWQNFNAAVIETELRRGRMYFPKINAIRLWLSWDAFVRNPDRFAMNFEVALAIAAKLDLRVMPVLFNRWHSDSIDYGGIYIDHFLPGACWVSLIADAHRPKFGPLGGPGNLAFIEADGSLRPGHEVFNEF